jgi:hypothetical protein
MAIPGTWDFFYDWGCTGHYVAETVTFNGDGTWTSSQGFKGQWVSLEGEFILNIAGYATVYSGNVAGNAAVGIMTDFLGGTGCWYMVKQGIPAAQKSATGHSLAGKQQK